MKAQRLVVVSNRLPVTAEVVAGEARLRHSSGGLVSALVPILRRTGGCWVGSPGPAGDESLTAALNNFAGQQNYSLAPVYLTECEQNDFYRGFSNEIVWPLFHRFPSRCEFSPRYWSAYRSANEKFAAALEKQAGHDDLLWVHDYHLMLVADAMGPRKNRECVAYFHHIPFPPPEIFEILPWRQQILLALMKFDLLGFQTSSDQHNFIACLAEFIPGVHVRRLDGKYLASLDGHSTVIGMYPISIDTEEFVKAAVDPAVIAESQSIRSSAVDGSIILGLDRLDYTKGILERLGAFRQLLESRPECRGQVHFIQIVVPSREDIVEYQRLKRQIENLVSQINGDFGTRGWTPIRYFYRSISRSEVVAFYRAADVAMVTPVKDGMNLVAKEFCASRVDNQGVLILSEFAGAVEELKQGALVVNPHDQEGMVSALSRALLMTDAEQRGRMHLMRSHLQCHDVFHWARIVTTDCREIGDALSRSAMAVPALHPRTVADDFIAAY